jgi:hypothetical protein
LETRLSGTACPTCSELGEYIEIENPQAPSDEEGSHDFPAAVAALRVPNASLERYYRYSSERLLKCPDCGAYFWYREWAPGGSEDVMRTYIHESVRRLSYLETHVELDDVRYQARQRIEERGGDRTGMDEIAVLGAEEELQALRVTRREVVSDAVAALENRHARAAEFEATTAFRAKMLEEARERREVVAAYRAEVLARYLQYWEQESLEPGLLCRIVELLADDNDRVRTTIEAALKQALNDGLAPQQWAPKGAGLGELLEACRTAGL